MMTRFGELIGDRPVHLIGAGSLSSKYAPTLTVKGVRTIHVWDDDVVEARNLYNQRFLPEHIGMPKVEAVADYCRRLKPDGQTTFVLHREKLVAGTPLSGIVLAGVDSMKSRGVTWSCVRNNPVVSFFADGRVAMEGGKAFGLNPNNPEHVYRYEHEPHWHPDPENMQHGACKTEFPRPEMSDIVAAHVLVRLSEWLDLEQGRADPYLNFYAFCFVPRYCEATEYWDLDDEQGADESDD